MMKGSLILIESELNAGNLNFFTWEIMQLDNGVPLRAGGSISEALETFPLPAMTILILIRVFSVTCAEQLATERRF